MYAVGSKTNINPMSSHKSQSRSQTITPKPKEALSLQDLQTPTHLPCPSWSLSRHSSPSSPFRLMFTHTATSVHPDLATGLPTKTRVGKQKNIITRVSTEKLHGKLVADPLLVGITTRIKVRRSRLPTLLDRQSTSRSH